DSQNQLGGPNGQLLSVATSFMNRVKDKPLFTVDLNCHCYDPTKTFVLNKDAWANPPGGQYGTAAAYYDDYRFQRRPGASVAFGRTFRIKERASLNIGAEFTNMSNRAQAPDPIATNALATQLRKDKNAPNSPTTGGFGFINVVAQPPAGT